MGILRAPERPLAPTQGLGQNDSYIPEPWPPGAQGPTHPAPTTFSPTPTGKGRVSQVWHTPLMPELRQLRQEGQKAEASWVA
jgi:hypothetical protein